VVILKHPISFHVWLEYLTLAAVLSHRIQESGIRIQLGILTEKADSAGGKRVFLSRVKIADS
jgi:hypothetical protein